MDNKNREEIYFTNENIFSEISKILGKNGIEESPIDAMFKDEQSFIGIVLGLIKDFATGNISEKELSLSLQKQLGVSIQTAESIVKDIKEKILPLVEKNTVQANQKKENPTTQIETEGKIINRIPAPVKPDAGMKTIQKIEEVKKISTGPDAYREPIE